MLGYITFKLLKNISIIALGSKPSTSNRIAILLIPMVKLPLTGSSLDVSSGLSKYIALMTFR